MYTEYQKRTGPLSKGVNCARHARMSLSNTCLTALFIIRCSCYLVYSSYYLYIFFEVVLSPRRLVVIDTPRSIGVNPFRTPAHTLLLVFCVWSVHLSIDTIFQNMLFVSWFIWWRFTAYKKATEPMIRSGYLKSSFRKFYGRHHDLVNHYGIAVS